VRGAHTRGRKVHRKTTLPPEASEGSLLAWNPTRSKHGSMGQERIAERGEAIYSQFNRGGLINEESFTRDDGKRGDETDLVRYISAKTFLLHGKVGG